MIGHMANQQLASISTKIPAKIYDKLLSISKQNKRSLAGQIAFILEAYLQENK